MTRSWISLIISYVLCTHLSDEKLDLVSPFLIAIFTLHSYFILKEVKNFMTSFIMYISYRYHIVPKNLAAF